MIFSLLDWLITESKRIVITGTNVETVLVQDARKVVPAPVL